MPSERDSTPLQKGRKSWLARILVASSIIIVVTYGFTKNRKVLVNIYLSMLGIVLTPVLRCFCIFVEELCRSCTWTRRNVLNSFRRSFRGTVWKPIVAVVLIDGIALWNRSSFELELDVISILSGVSVSPLVTYLFKPNVQSDHTESNDHRYHTESQVPLVSTEQPQKPDDTQGPSLAEGTSSREHIVDIEYPYQSSEKATAPQFQLRKRTKSDSGSSTLNLETSSSILKGETAFIEQLQKWLGVMCKWNLCYRASRDGWSAQDFHRHCDNKGATVVLVKANDCIFGGYTDQHWDPSQNVTWKSSNSSFLFSLRNKENLPPFIANIQQGKEQFAIICNSDYGPSFGGGFDLFICDNPQFNNQSFSKFGRTYQLPPGYVYDSEKTNKLLAGQKNFQTTEIEVFQ